MRNDDDDEQDGPDPRDCILCSNWGTCPYHGGGRR
jgi:hypothetical protein